MEDTNESAPAITAAARYTRFVTDREPFLHRARRCSELTIPSLIPPSENNKGGDLYEPFQSVGARGVNNLSAKLLLALFPPGSSPVRLTVDTLVLEEMERKAEENGADFDSFRAEMEKALSSMERAVVNRMEQKGIRTTLNEGLKHLLVGGNICLQVLKGGGARLHTLDSYVVKRDAEGNVLWIIVKETISKDALPQEVIDHIDAHPEVQAENTSGREDEIDLYTVVERDQRAKKWVLYQEAGGMVIPKTKGREPLDKPSFLPLRLVKVDGEDYGRGFVEEYRGDLASYEDLCKAIVEYSAAVSKIIGLVKDSGLTDKEELTRAASGSFIDGDANEVSILSFAEKSVDFKVTESTAAKIEQRLEQAFLLLSSIQRSGERVTAEEIRTLANELEQGLGGIYSILAQELQRPLFERIMWQMQKDGDLPSLPSDSIAPQVLGGLEGLSRSSDLTKLDRLLAGVAELFGPEAVAEYANPGVYMTLRAAALGIDTKGLIRSEDEVQATRQRQLQAELAGKLVPTAMKVGAEQMQAPAAAA